MTAPDQSASQSLPGARAGDGNPTNDKENRMPPDINLLEKEMEQASERARWQEINALADKADEAEFTEDDPLVRRLRGRADFLRNCGEVKTPELLESAAKELEAAAQALRPSLDNDEAQFRAILARMPQWAPEYEQHRPWVEALMRYVWVDTRAMHAAAPAVSAPHELPPAYMLAKLQMVIPVFQEARDALTALSFVQMKLHDISPTLAARMDEAGTFSLDDWTAMQPGFQAPEGALQAAPADADLLRRAELALRPFIQHSSSEPTIQRTLKTTNIEDARRVSYDLGVRLGLFEDDGEAWPAAQSPAEGDERDAFKAWENAFINETGYPGTDFECFQAGAAWDREQAGAASNPQPKGMPVCPQEIVNAITAYGDARADQDANDAPTTSPMRLADCIRLIRAALAVQAPAVGADDMRDAARYRWLRDKANSDTKAMAPMVFNAPGNGRPVQWRDALYGEWLDTAMDAAIGISKPPVQGSQA